MKITQVRLLSFLVAVLSISLIMGCASEPKPKEQQKAFYVDAEGNLKDKRDDIVKKAGEFKLENGYYVDNNGERINRRIDDTKEKINETVDKTKEGMKTTFRSMFNTRVKGEAYVLTDIKFKEGSHLVKAYSKPEFMALIETLKEHPEGRIQVQAFTSEGKNKMECKELARLRAEHVKSMIVTLGGNKEQISSKGIGLTAKDAEKAVENRVEIRVEG